MPSPHALLDHRVIVGFHGCDQATADRVLVTGEPMKPSSNRWDWLGEGIYVPECGAAGQGREDDRPHESCPGARVLRLGDRGLTGSTVMVAQRQKARPRSEIASTLSTRSPPPPGAAALRPTDSRASRTHAGFRRALAS